MVHLYLFLFEIVIFLSNTSDKYKNIAFSHNLIFCLHNMKMKFIFVLLSNIARLKKVIKWCVCFWRWVLFTDRLNISIHFTNTNKNFCFFQVALGIVKFFVVCFGGLCIGAIIGILSSILTKYTVKVKGWC